jgi:5-hydroxyisourate hydrolase
VSLQGRVSPVSAVTTHVLDTARGMPAEGVAVRLERVPDPGGTGTPTGAATEIGRARTDRDGRASDLGPETLQPGSYRLVFDVAGYLGPEAFFPEVVITFTVTGGAAHYHVPLLLSPFGYSTYRGS